MSINTPYLGFLQVAGEGAKKLLQGQFTCNLDDISETQSRLGAHCNPQGRILSLFRVFFYRHNYYLQMPTEMLVEAQAALQKYAPFFKVTLSDASSTLSRVVYTAANLASYFPHLPTQTDAMVSMDDLVIIKLPTTETLYEIMGEPAKIAEITRQLPPSPTLNNVNGWQQLQIASGIPSIYPETAGKLLPHEINLQQINSLSFNKGCYTGQEIIARMHYRGQLKKRMYRAEVNSNTLPTPGADIFDSSPCGTIVTSCHTADNTYHMLVIANQADIESKQLFLDPANTQPLKLLTLPY